MKKWGGGSNRTPTVPRTDRGPCAGMRSSKASTVAITRL
jgi:hypothetical protein